MDALMTYTMRWQTGDIWPHHSPELTLDARSTALLLIDMQVQSRHGRAVVFPCQALLHLFRRCGLPVIYLTVGPLLPDGRDLHGKRRYYHQVLESASGRHAPAGGRGAEMMPELAPEPHELVLNKNSSGAFSSTVLERYLYRFGVQNIVICGVSTSRCVGTTARAAADRGFNVVLVGDACSDRSGTAQHLRTLRTFGAAFGSVKTVAEVTAYLTPLLSSYNRSTAGDRA